ncbi:hypothetical protein KGF57_005173 [Candida theae]|uniref:Uncharacterized protein n=1 Tax=Candida theae TaxID=1198502 RepID=A0AAD5FW45_9ASCO|nr:uncharacterized protein KGF57_005173 [Candida theae]KAI5948775.1 hypothetical protein KGF57_005173 [Candida theae]
MTESTVAAGAAADPAAPTESKDSSVAQATVTSSSTTTPTTTTTTPIPTSKPQPQYSPKIITSLDCKLLQYQYGIYKLENFITSLKRLHSSTTEIPMIHYIVLLTGSVFAINDKSFDSRFDKLANFRPIQIGTVNIAPNVSHIPYDIPDLPVSALDDFPSLEDALKCLKQVEILTQVCLSGYKKRLELARGDKENSTKGTNLETYYSKVDSIISHDIFHQDIDLQLNDVSFPITDDQQSNIQHYEEASLIDMDLKELFVIIQQMEKSLAKLKPEINTLKKSQVDDSFALHKIFLLTSRLNEIYTIVRRFGRKIYLSNHQHLVDAKFLHHCPNAAYFKTNVLKNMDDYYNSMKKNGTLIANITRLIRQDTRLEINSKNVSTHINFVVQGLNVTEKCLNVLKEFGLSWIVSERKFRNVYNLPKGNLNKIFESVSELKPKPPPQAKVASKTQQPLTLKPSSHQTSAMERHLKSLDLNDNGGGRRSRSSSTSSVNSNGSNSSTPSSGLMRRGSLTSPNKGVSTSRVTSPRARPNSMLFQQQQHNSSTSSLENGDAGDGKAATSISVSQNAKIQGRQRSNSHPLANEVIATSGAAAALKASGTKAASPYKQSQQQQKKQEQGNADVQQNQSQQRSPQRAQSPPQTETNAKVLNGDSYSSITKKLLAVSEESTEEDASSGVRRSASQRLQQHIRDAAKSGDMMTTQRETFNSVVYDPNQSNQLHMKRYIDRPKTTESQSPEPTLSHPPSSATTVNSTSTEAAHAKTQRQPLLRTRDQVTRNNTQRNSFIPDVPTKASAVDSQPVSQDNSSNSTAASSSTLGSSVEDIPQAGPAPTTTTSISQSETSTDVVSGLDDQTTLIVGTTNEGATSVTQSTPPIIKKVRFTGVPEYTAAEDAPTKYSHAILRNFAVFRSPSKTNKERKHYFTKSDQLLKEESLSFRANQTLNEGEPVLPSQVMPQPIPPVSTTKRGLGLSKFRFKSS